MIVDLGWDVRCIKGLLAYDCIKCDIVVSYVAQKCKCLWHFIVVSVFVILLVPCLLVIQCSCHWSQLKATFLLIYCLGVSQVSLVILFDTNSLLLWLCAWQCNIITVLFQPVSLGSARSQCLHVCMCDQNGWKTGDVFTLIGTEQFLWLVFCKSFGCIYVLKVRFNCICKYLPSNDALVILPQGLKASAGKGNVK